MRLFMVEDYDRWGYSLNVVRAASEDEARQLVAPHSEADNKRIDITPLDVDGTPAIVWCRDESPDTPRES